MQDVRLLKEALPYIRRFKDQIFVVKIGGEVLRDQADLDNLSQDVSLMQSVGIRIVIVHGGGAQVTSMEEKLGVKSRMVGGRRVTDEASLDVLKMVLSGTMNLDVVSALQRTGAHALGVSGVSGGIIKVKKRPPVVVSGGGPEPVDFGLVGDVVSVNTKLLHGLLENDLIPVISPLSADEDGKIYNVNADVVASRIASELKAEKLLFMATIPGVMIDVKDRTTLISQLSAEQARQAIKDGIITGGMIPKVEESMKAIAAGVRTVHILSAQEPNQLLLEIFTQSGCGTMLVP